MFNFIFEVKQSLLKSCSENSESVFTNEGGRRVIY